MKNTIENNEWADKAMLILRSLGRIDKNNKEIINHQKDRTILWVVSTFLITAIFATLFFYAGSNDWFKSNINQNVSLDPQIDSYTYNEYEIPIDNDNKIYLNTTILNEIIIEECEEEE